MVNVKEKIKEIEWKTTFEKILTSHLFLTIVAILLAFICGGIFLSIMGYNPFFVYSTLIKGAFSRPRFIAYSIVYATPLIFVGLSVAFSFKTGVFNIGAEGQFVVGAMAACLVGIFVNAPSFITVLLCFLASIIAGSLWGMAVGFLKTKWGINEVLSMIMFNWVAFYLSNYLVTIPAIHSNSAAEATKNIGPNASIMFSESIRDRLCPTSNYGIIIAILVVIAIHIIINKTTLGFELKAVGANPNAAEFAGISVKKSILTAMAISGLLAGLGGAVHVMGMSGRISLYSAQEGFGFEGITVALIGLSEPLGVFFSSLFYGALKYSGNKLNLINAPSEIIKVITGTIVFFIAISHVFRINFKKGDKKKLKVKKCRNKGGAEVNNG